MKAMSKNQLIIKHPEVYLEIIKDGVELALNGCTEFNTVEDVEEHLEEIKKKWLDWEQKEDEYLKLI